MRAGSGSLKLQVKNQIATWRKSLPNPITHSITTITTTVAMANSSQLQLRTEIIYRSLKAIQQSLNHSHQYRSPPSLPRLSVTSTTHFQPTHSRTVTNPATISLNLPTTQTLPETSFSCASRDLLPWVVASFKAPQGELAPSGASYWSHTHSMRTTISNVSN